MEQQKIVENIQQKKKDNKIKESLSSKDIQSLYDKYKKTMNILEDK